MGIDSASQIAMERERYWQKGHSVGKQGKYIDRKDTRWGNRENILSERTHGGETGKIY